MESVTIGYVFKCGFYLPENASNYLNYLEDPFDLTPRPISGNFRKARQFEEVVPVERPKLLKKSSGYDEKLRERFEKYEVEPLQVEAVQEEVEEALTEPDNWKEEEEEDEEEYSGDPKSPKGPQNFATSRWSIYESIAHMALGYDGFHF